MKTIATPTLQPGTRVERLNADRIRSAAAGRWHEVLNQVAGIDDEFLSTSHGPCPKCGGEDRWRCFDDYHDSGGCICNKCGKMADGFSVIQWILNCDFRESIRCVNAHLGDPSSDRHVSPVVSQPAKQKTEIPDDVARLRAEVNGELPRLLPLSDKHQRDLLHRGFPNADIGAFSLPETTQEVNSAFVKINERFSGQADEICNQVPGFVRHPQGLFLAFSGRGLAIPVKNFQGMVMAYQVRSDRERNPKKRYTWLSGKECKAKPKLMVHHAFPKSQLSELWVTEGPLKATYLQVAKHYHSIGIAGVGLWEHSLPTIEHLAPPRIVLAFDQDEAGQSATRDMAERLLSDGRSVEVATW